MSKEQCGNCVYFHRFGIDHAEPVVLFWNTIYWFFHRTLYYCRKTGCPLRGPYAPDCPDMIHIVDYMETR